MTSTDSPKFGFPLYDTIITKLAASIPAQKKLKVKQKKELCGYINSSIDDHFKEIIYLLIIKYDTMQIDRTQTSYDTTSSEDGKVTLVWDVVNMPDKLLLILHTYYIMDHQEATKPGNTGNN